MARASSPVVALLDFCLAALLLDGVAAAAGAVALAGGQATTTLAWAIVATAGLLSVGAGMWLYRPALPTGEGG